MIIDFTNRGKWNQDKMQEHFVRMIGNCELTAEQIGRISAHLIENNKCLGGKNSVNKASIERFKLEQDSLLAPESNWIEETRKKVV